jgi:hypothetical protein
LGGTKNSALGQIMSRGDLVHALAEPFMPDDNVMSRDPITSDPGFPARNLGVDLNVAIQGGRDNEPNTNPIKG